jgi:hypothetical protein
MEADMKIMKKKKLNNFFVNNWKNRNKGLKTGGGQGKR